MKVGLNLEPEDLGEGFTLVFQQAKNDAAQLRAVVKDPAGAVVTRGPVVPERELQRSKFMAVTEWLDAKLAAEQARREAEAALAEADDYGADDETEEDEEELL